MKNRSAWTLGRCVFAISLCCFALLGGGCTKSESESDPEPSPSVEATSSPSPTPSAPTLTYPYQSVLWLVNGYASISPEAKFEKPGVFTVKPDLPSGIIIGKETGVIEGIPSSPSPAQKHTITLTDAGGEASAAITVWPIKILYEETFQYITLDSWNSKGGSALSTSSSEFGDLCLSLASNGAYATKILPNDSIRQVTFVVQKDSTGVGEVTIGTPTQDSFIKVRVTNFFEYYDGASWIQTSKSVDANKKYTVVILNIRNNTADLYVDNGFVKTIDTFGSKPSKITQIKFTASTSKVFFDDLGLYDDGTTGE